MAEKPVDYSAVLKDLKTRKQALEKAIQGIELLIVSGGSVTASASDVRDVAQTNDSAAVATETPSVGIESDSFFKMTMVDAAKKFLRMAKRKQSSKAIADALEKGGITHSSRDFPNTVGAGLRRQQAKVGDVVNVNGEWGMAEWYPGLNRKRGGGGGEAGEAGG